MRKRQKEKWGGVLLSVRGLLRSLRMEDGIGMQEGKLARYLFKPQFPYLNNRLDPHR